MEILTGLLVLIVALGPLVLLGFIWRRCHRRLRAKRYGPFAITGLFLTLLAACFLMLYPFLAAFAAVFGSPVLWAGLALLLTRMLPVRAGSRRAGKRRAGRASVWGWLFIIVGGATWLFFSWQLIFPTLMTRADAWKGWFVVAGITMAASQYFSTSPAARRKRRKRCRRRLLPCCTFAPSTRKNDHSSSDRDPS